MLAIHRVLLLAAFCCGTAAAAFDPVAMVKGWISGLMGSAADAAKGTACDNAINPVLDELEKKAQDKVDEQCKPMAEQSDLLGECCSAQGEKIATEPVATQRDGLKEKCMAIEKASDVPSNMKSALADAKTQLTEDFESIPEKMKDALSECAGKEAACKSAISPVLDPVQEKLEKQVEDQCKPMEEKSDEIGECCKSKGGDIVSTPIANQQELLMGKCAAIDSVADIPSKMEAAIKESADGFKNDVQDVPEQLKDALPSCADEKIHEAVEDKASDATQQAIDTVKDTASDATAKVLGKHETDKKSESKFELRGRVSPNTSVPLAAPAALVFLSLVVFSAGVMVWRRRRTPAVEEVSEPEANTYSPVSVDEELEALLEQ